MSLRALRHSHKTCLCSVALSGSSWVPRDPTLHELDCQGGVYKNTRLEAASCFLGVLPLFSFRGPPPISNFGVHGDFHYYRYFLRLPGLLFIGPCMAMFFYVISEPNGIIEEPPRPFWSSSLPLSWRLRRRWFPCINPYP